MNDKLAELELLLQQEESNLTTLGKERITELKEELKFQDNDIENIS